MIIAFQSVAMSNAGGILESHTATAVSAHSVSIFNFHDFLREVAFIHIKI